MNEWMFNDNPAQKTDRLLGIRGDLDLYYKLNSQYNLLKQKTKDKNQNTPTT